MASSRDLSSHIPAADRGRVTTEEHSHRFALAEPGAEVDLLLTPDEPERNPAIEPVAVRVRAGGAPWRAAWRWCG